MLQQVNWLGASGTIYSYFVYPIHERPPTNDKGNYIFAKRRPLGGWDAVYVGQGELRNRYDAAIREKCVNRKGATHYHRHMNPIDVRREAEEADIIDGHPECRAPDGCNEVSGTKKAE